MRTSINSPRRIRDAARASSLALSINSPRRIRDAARASSLALSINSPRRIRDAARASSLALSIIAGLCLSSSTIALADDAKPAPKKAGSCKVQNDHDVWPYLDAPSDPWQAVASNKPINVTPSPGGLSTPNLPRKGHTCDAAHDHCMRDCSWLVTNSPTDRTATAYHYVNNKFVSTGRSGDPPAELVAYRTVPVTKKNVKVGALVMSITEGRADAGGNVDRNDNVDRGPFGVYWEVGFVESIEWDRNLVRLEGRRDAFYLSATRVVVLKYTLDGGVEKISDATAPAVVDVISPIKKAVTNDAMAQVGKDKLPIAIDDKIPFTSIDSDCSSKFDHCLRPYVWFVDTDGEMVPSRWTGKAFVHADDPKRVIDKPGLAYRTRPAQESELTKGKKVLVYDEPSRPQNEAAAHFWRAWSIRKVDSVDRYTHVVTLDEGETKRPSDNVRILVVFWLPGEKAEPVE